MRIALCAASGVLFMLVPETVAQTRSQAAGSRSTAAAAEVGLPIYPGAAPDRDGDPSHFPGPIAFNDSGSAVVDVRAGRTRSKVIVIRLQTPDSPDRVAGFYRQALAKYGIVLDCGRDGTATAPEGITCAAGLGGKPPSLQPDEVLLRAGTRNREHLVGIQTRAGLTTFQLVYNEFKRD